MSAVPAVAAALRLWTDPGIAGELTPAIRFELIEPITPEAAP